MGRIFASLIIAAALTSVATSEASAWVCRATGLGCGPSHRSRDRWVCRTTGLGSGGWARSGSIIDAKFWALRRCERHSPVPVCTLVYCRPGW